VVELRCSDEPNLRIPHPRQTDPPSITVPERSFSGRSLHLDELPLGTIRPVLVGADGGEAGALVDGDRPAVEARDREPELVRCEAAAGEVQARLEEALAEAPSRPSGMESESDFKARAVGCCTGGKPIRLPLLVLTAKYWSARATGSSNSARSQGSDVQS
jgi:hypothetical protein